jgi:hypothetical protein
MKKFNSWLNESKFEEKNIIKEDYNPTFSNPSAANISKLKDLKVPFNRYQAKVQELQAKHVTEEGDTRSQNRANLLRLLGLLSYNKKKEFENDWNYVKSHIVDTLPKDPDDLDDNTTIDNPEKLDNFIKDDLNVDRK